MVVSEKVYELCELVNSGEELTTKKLNEIGLNSNKITEYINKGIINRISRGKYELLNDNLVNYMPNIYRELIELMNKNELGKFSKLLLVANSNNKEINRVYVYLASLIYPISSELRDVLEQYKNEGFYIEQESYTSDYINYVIYLLFAKKFTPLINFVEKSVENEEDKLLLLLLNKVQKKYWTSIKILNLLAFEKNYEEIVRLLEKEQEILELPKFKLKVQMLAKKYLELDKCIVIPKKKKEDSDSLYSAIMNNDFEKALSFCNKKDDEDIIYDIVHDIYVISKRRTFNAFIEDIEKSGSIIEIVNKIDEFLIPYGKERYSSLLLDTIKIDLHYNKYNYKKYSRSKSLVNDLINNKFIYQTNYYIKEFYYELSKGNISNAQSYLNILNNGKFLGYFCPICELLENVLLYTTRLYNNEEVGVINFSIMNNDCSIVDEEYNELNADEEDEYIEEDESVEEEKEYVPVNKQEEIYNQSDINYILNQIDRVRNSKEIKVLKKIKGNRLNVLEEKVSESEDTSYIKVGERYILVYTPDKNNDIDCKSLIIEGEKIYREQKYKDALLIYKKVLWTGKAKAYTYAKIGLCHLKLNNIKACIDYLNVATELSRYTGKNYDFSLLIEKLTNRKTEIDEDNKVYVKFNEYDFDEDKYHGITCIPNIIENINNGMSIEESIMIYNLNEEQTLVALLVLAIENYKHNEFELGDALYKKVEKHNNKTKKVIKLMEEIQRNKKFYMYREDNQYKKIKA